MKLGGQELPPEAIFLYVCLTQGAIKVHELGRDKKYFIRFAGEIWDAMLMSDPETLKQQLTEYAAEDLLKHL